MKTQNISMLMQSTPKGPAQKRRNAVPVLRKQGQVNEATMIMADMRWMKRLKGNPGAGTIRSHDTVFLRRKTGTMLNSQEVARAIIAKQVVANSKHFVRNPEVLKIMESMIRGREAFFSGTRIKQAPPRQVYLMKMLNRMPAIDGKSKMILAEPIIAFISQEADLMHKMANSPTVQKQTRSDAFANAAVNIALIPTVFDMYRQNPKMLIKSAKEFIAQRAAERAWLLRTENLSAESIKLSKILQRQITETEMEMHEYASSHRIDAEEVKIQKK
jgi:hypothetical protein